MYLCKDVRITLIKSTLSNMLIYFMSLFLLLANIANHIEKLRWGFLWDGIGELFKFYLIKLVQGLFSDL
jgi:hypothetical protein